MTKRLRRAAFRERARRFATMYALSAAVLCILLAPFVVLFLMLD